VVWHLHLEAHCGGTAFEFDIDESNEVVKQKWLSTRCQKDEYSNEMVLGVPFIYCSGAKKAFAPTSCSKH
jgi:hypothetical protein